MHSMEKRASIVCGDGLFDESSDYLKIEEQLCASRICAIEAELASRSSQSMPSSLSVPSDAIEVLDDDEFDMTIPDKDLLEMEIPAAPSIVSTPHPWDDQVRHSLRHISDSPTFDLISWKRSMQHSLDATCFA